MMSARDDIRTKRRRSARQHQQELRRLAEHERAAACRVVTFDGDHPIVNAKAVMRAVREAVRRDQRIAEYLVPLDPLRLRSASLPLEWSDAYTHSRRMDVELEAGGAYWPRRVTMHLRSFDPSGKRWEVDQIDIHQDEDDRSITGWGRRT